MKKSISGMIVMVLMITESLGSDTVIRCSGYYDDSSWGNYITRITGEGCVTLDCPTTVEYGTSSITISSFSGIGNANQICQIDPKITTLVLPTNSIAFRNAAFDNNSHLEKIVFRSSCTFPSKQSHSAYHGYTFEEFNNTFVGAFGLREVWLDHDSYANSYSLEGLINSGIFRYANAVYYRASLSNTVGKVLRNIYGGNRVCYKGTWDKAKIISVNDKSAGYIDPPSVVTNYVFSTVTNHIYHHDVVTDMTAYYTTVTNVYVHYVKENAKPTFILPSSYDTGFVNVVAEVEGGYAVIPATWSVNYPGFTERYGSDFSKALSKPNGKYDRRGNPMYVWQDYVAGTNPMDETDVFDATIAIEGGTVNVSHTPKLDADREALRKYTVYGKKNLMDSEWQVVEPGEELNYNFYRVTVRMR